MKDELRIVPYDPEWPVAFVRERMRLAGALGRAALRIDHNGSTAVPGLSAKPIIDIQVSVQQLQPMDCYAPALGGLGYVHVPHADDAFCPFFHRPRVWPHTHHVHVVAAGSDEERRTLAFRDYLRDHPQLARDYAALKQQLVQRHAAADHAAREAYARGKTDFVTSVVEQALAAGYPRAG